MTDLATWTKIKAERRAAEKAAKLAAQVPPTTALPVAPERVIPPSEQAVIRIEAKLVEARAALEQTELDLSEASYLAIAAEPGMERATNDMFAEARRARDLAHEKVSATAAALDVARDRQKQAIQNDRAIAHAEQVAAVRGALQERARHVATLSHHLAAAVQSYREILKASAAAVRAYPGGVAPAGALLGTGDLIRAVEHELYRISADPFVASGKSRLPAFPGATSPSIVAAGNPGAIPPLEGKIIGANEFVIHNLANIAPPSVPVIRAVPKASARAAAPAPQVAPVETMTAIEAADMLSLKPADLSHHLQPNLSATVVVDAVAAPALDAASTLNLEG